jgi:hypothetical protein
MSAGDAWSRLAADELAMVEKGFAEAVQTLGQSRRA